MGISHAALGPQMSFGPPRAGLGSSCIRRDKPAGARKPVDISWWYPAHSCALGDARDLGQAVCSDKHAVKSELQLSCNQQEKYGHLLHVRINRYFLNVFGFRLNTGKATRATHREKNGEHVLYTGD